MAKQARKDNPALKWFITIFITTFMLSILFSYVSTNSISNLPIIPAVLILVLVIFIGVFFDIIGVAVTVAEEEHFHAKASKKIDGAKASIGLIRNSAKVANICADVIGDICGVISGSIAALISIKLCATFQLPDYFQYIISAMVASLTVGGKALGKGVAQAHATSIVHIVGILGGKFKRKNKKRK